MLPVLRILTNRGTAYCSKAEQHDDPLSLALNDSEHSQTRVKSPQTHGICERFHKTIKDAFDQITLRKMRKKSGESLDDVQHDFDHWRVKYNVQCTHQGKASCAAGERRWRQTSRENTSDIWMEKFVNQTSPDRHHR